MSATNDHKFFNITYKLHSFFKRVGCLTPFKRITAITAYNNVFSTWKRSADRLIGLSTHDDRFSKSYSFKVGKISWQMPRHSIVFTYNTIVSHSSNKRDNRFMHFFP